MNIDAKSKRAVPSLRCPACGTVADRPRCPACGIWMAGDQAAELRWIEAELRRIDEARAWLYDRRAALLADLVKIPAVSAGQPEALERVARDTDLARHELSRRTAGRLLLATGAVLVVVATIAFTAANWSTIGPLGRCAILLAVTAVALVVPVWLRRRDLSATAETLAAIGLALTIADAYLMGQLIPSPGLLEVAATCAALAALWAGYGLAARLTTPRLAAIIAAQFPLVIAAIALARTAGGTIEGPAALALLVTSAADLKASSWLSRHAHRALTLTSSIAATVTWVAATLLAAAVMLATSLSPARALWMSAVFVTAGVISACLVPGSAISWLPAAPVAVLSGGLLAIGPAIPAAAVLTAGWAVVPFALTGVLVAAGALVLARIVASRDAGAEAGRSPGVAARLRLVAAGSTAIAGVAGLIEVPAALSAMFPWRHLTDVWSGPTLPAGPYVMSPGSGALAPVVVLGLASLACWAAPVRRQWWLRPAAAVIAALAAGAIPAAGLTGWAALAVLTAAAAIMLGASALRRSAGHDRAAVATACGGVALAVSAALWSLPWAAATIIELAVLTAMFCLYSASAATVGQLAAGCAIAAATGLAYAGPAASGWPVRLAAFAMLGVAACGGGAATLLARVRPRHAVVLDAGAGLAALLAAIITVRQPGTFATVASITALGASSIGWLRTERRRAVVLCSAIFAVLAAIAAAGRPLALALFEPYTEFAEPWHGAPHAPLPGLASAIIVAGTCAVAVTAAAGAWRGGRTSLDAVAVALPIVVAPAGLAAGLSYPLMVCLLLILAVGLTAWAAASRSLAPAGAALAAATLALAWALAAPLPTLTVLGSLSAAYALCAWRARRADAQAALACLCVLSTAAFTEAAALAARWAPWQAGLVVLGVAAGGLIAAALLRSARHPVERLGAASLASSDPLPRASVAVEAAAWFAVAAGAVQCLNRPGPASTALAIAGLLCVAVSARDDRRPALWLGVALCEAALCIWLFAAGVTAPEAYAVPVAAAWIAYGWYRARQIQRLSSWVTYGPGLALLLLPSLTAVWHDPGWIRPLWLGLLATAITLIGGRARLQAPLLIGAAVTALDAGRELAPELLQLAHTVPTWVPIAATGAVLLWAGATYEARLRNLKSLRNTVSAMR